MFLQILAVASSFATPSADVRVAQEILRNLPRWVESENKWTAAELEIFADPKGEVLTCEVRRFVAHEDVAEEMCKGLIGRRVVHAKNFQGEKSYGLGLMITIVDDDRPSGVDSRLGGLQQDGVVLTVNRLPPDAESSGVTRLPLDLEIGIDGAVAQCEASGDPSPALRKVACEQVTSIDFEIRKGSEGNAVRYVRNFDIVFELPIQ